MRAGRDGALEVRTVDSPVGVQEVSKSLPLRPFGGGYAYAESVTGFATRNRMLFWWVCAVSGVAMCGCGALLREYLSTEMRLTGVLKAVRCFLSRQA